MMKMMKQTMEGTNAMNSALQMPTDLTKWVDSCGLIGMSLEAVAETALPFPSKNFHSPAGQFRPQMLLTLLTYAYATGTYASQTIEGALPQDKGLQYICAGNWPDWNTLRLFRWKNRALIEGTLAQVLRSAWQSRFPKNADRQESYAANSLGRWLDSPRTPGFELEAQNRLKLAVQADSIMMDE